MLSADAAREADYDAFAARAQGDLVLYLTRPRASALGLHCGAEGCLAPLHGRSYVEAQSLAYLAGAPPPESLQPAPPLFAAARELCRIGLLLPALVASGAPALTQRPDFPAVDVLDITAALALAKAPFEIVARTAIPLREWGEAEFVAFRGGPGRRDHIGLIFGSPDTRDAVPVRLHSSCLTGDLFGSLRCDCGDQLRLSLGQIRELGSGVLLYLEQEGRGNGIAAKLRAYKYQACGLDTFDADAALGFEHDERTYGTAIAMLRALGISKVRLMTNNPAKLDALRLGGMEVVERIPLIAPETAENSRYLYAKAARGGHLLD